MFTYLQSRMLQSGTLVWTGSYTGAYRERKDRSIHLVWMRQRCDGGRWIVRCIQREIWTSWWLYCSSDVGPYSSTVPIGHLAAVSPAYAIASKCTRAYAPEMRESGKIVNDTRYRPR